MLATFLAYWPGLRNSFVWDDTALVLRDPLIRHWRQAPRAFGDFLFLDATASNFYRPMQRLTFTADYALWGIARSHDEQYAGVEKTGAPATGDGEDIAAIQRAAQPGWHFTSILIHALAAVALWRLLRVWFGTGWGPLLVALLWAVHPLHTSAVTYVAGRADPLAGLFVFAALALVARAHVTGGLPPGDRPASQCVIGAAVCAFAALLSKESGVAALTLWLVWVACKATRNARAWLVWGCAVVVGLAGYLALRVTADQTPVPPSTRESPVIMRPVLAARALAEYAALFVAPHELHMERDVSIRPGDDEATVRFRHLQTGAGLLLAIGLILWARWAARRAPDAALALACFAITWLPISNLFKLNATVAEHWLYVPSAFLLTAIFATLGRPREGTAPRWLAAAAGVWLVFFIVQTWRQQSYWQDQRTFVEETARRSGAGPRMLVNLGQLAMSDKQPDRALDYYRQALAKDPDLAVAHFNIAAVAAQKKDFDTALAELALVEKSPLFAAAALLVRANILEAQTGKPQIHLLAQACDAAPRNWDVCRRLPEKHLALGHPDDAFRELLRQNKVHPYRAESWELIGYILETKAADAIKAGNPKGALEALGVAARAYGDAANADLRDENARRKVMELRPAL